MNKYIKISNHSVNVSRLSLEKLGLSTKRNDPETIGQFGSGIKYAPISALRLGIEFVFTGHDEKGKYILTYDKKQEDGIDCIIYNYGDYTKDSSFTVDAGKMSWETHFQIYREVFSNAKDAGNYNVEVVDCIDEEQKDNEFAVYISASPEMMDVYNDHDKYFCENRKVIFANKKDSYANKHSIIKSYNNENLRIYCKSVLVHTKHEVNHLFDYELNDASLNEDRELKHIYSAEYDISTLILKIDDKGLICKILNDLFVDQKQYWEFGDTSSFQTNGFYFGTINSGWKESFYEIFGSKAILVAPEISMIEGALYSIKLRGYEPIVAPNKAIYFLLKNAGVDDAIKILGERIIWDIDDDLIKYPLLMKAIKIASQFEPGLNKIKNPIGVFKSPSSNGTIVTGVTIDIKDPEKERILIEKIHAESGSIPEIVGTIIHEYDHLLTKVTDDDREFRNIADRRIGLLCCEFYNKQLISIKEEGIVFELSAVEEIGGLDYAIEYSIILGKFIVRIGKTNFVIEAPNFVYDEKSYNKEGVAEWQNFGKTGIFFIPFKQKLCSSNINIQYIK